MRIICDLKRGSRSHLQLVAQAGQFGFQKLAVVKRAEDGHAGDAIPRQKLLLEAHMSGAVNHPNLVHTYASAVDDGGPFLVMEYLPGQSLGALIARLTWDRDGVLLMLKVLIAVLDGLDSVHTTKSITGEHLGLVHRGVTWDNVQATYDGRIKLVDFGSASCFEYPIPHYPVDEDLRFSAPEILRTGMGDHRADLYSVGVMLWELCAGQRLYHSSSEDSLRHLLSADTPVVAPELPATLPWLPPAVHGICAHALAFDPNQRYASARKFRKDLCTLMGELGEVDLTYSDALSARLVACFSDAKLDLEAQVTSAVRAPFPIAPIATSPASFREPPTNRTDFPKTPSGPPGPAPWAPSPAGARALLPTVPFTGSEVVDHGPLPSPNSSPLPLAESEDATDKSPSDLPPRKKRSSTIVRAAIASLAAFTALAVILRVSPSSDEEPAEEPKSVPAPASLEEVPQPPIPTEPAPTAPSDVIQLEDLSPETPDDSPRVDDKATTPPPARAPRANVRPAARPRSTSSARKAPPKNKSTTPQAADQELQLSRSISWD